MAGQEQQATETTRPTTEAAEDATVHYPGKGFRLGEYVITGTLGQGAMATVYAATDATGHEVALKVFQEGPGVSKTMLERVRREAEASKKLRRHPHILTIYSTGRESPYQYIVMENIGNSQTLETAMESLPMSLKATGEMVSKVARALQYAHTRGIVHRDVKPSNIMIDEFGEPLLSDFGVAELVDWPSCTVTGALTGTPLYMSPEQARAERVGPASDIYSLGVVLFEAMTGVLPYSTQHTAPIKDVLHAVNEELPKRPRLYRKEISPDLEAVMLKTLEKNPNDRYIDAEAFAIDLDRALAGKPVSAHHFTPADRVRHFVRLHERLLTTLLLVGVATAGVGLFFRHKLVRMQYETLTSLASRKGELLAAQTTVDPANSPTGKAAALQEYHLGTRSIRMRDWQDARDHFVDAANLSIRDGELRLAARARLQQARCESMLDRREDAKATYLSVLRNNDASPPEANLAQLEYLLLALMTGDRDGAVHALHIRRPPREGAIRQAMDCLDGKLGTDQLLADIDIVPRHLREQLYLVAAVRSYLDGNARQATSFLKDASRSSGEWPAPLAQRLREEFRR